MIVRTARLALLRRFGRDLRALRKNLLESFRIRMSIYQRLLAAWSMHNAKPVASFVLNSRHSRPDQSILAVIARGKREVRR